MARRSFALKENDAAPGITLAAFARSTLMALVPDQMNGDEIEHPTAESSRWTQIAITITPVDSDAVPPDAADHQASIDNMAIVALRAAVAISFADQQAEDVGNTARIDVALNELGQLRSVARAAIASRLAELDPYEPSTVAYAVKGMIETHFEPKDIASLVGASRTTIGRWAQNQVIPRSPGYRKWLVERLHARLLGQEEAEGEVMRDTGSPSPVQTKLAKGQPQSHLRPIKSDQAA